MGKFEKFLSVWVGLCIVAGIAMGQLFPTVFSGLAKLEYANVNFPVAILIWAMVWPMMIGVDFANLKRVGDKPKGLVITLVVNWLIKPFTMAFLGVLFFKHVFAGLIPAQEAQGYIAGLILLGAAPCTAMVFVWSQLTKGDPAYTLAQVSINDAIMVFAFAPIVAFLLGVTDIAVPWATLMLAVGLYVVLPLIAGILARNMLMKKDGEQAVDKFIAKVKPFSAIGLLATVVLLFGFQGQVILDKPIIIALIAVPLLIQSYGIFAIAYGWAYIWKVPFNIAAPCAMIGTSNFFELAVAVAISLFGLNSGAALATVVGVLVEVPVMLSLVAFANKTQNHFPKSTVKEFFMPTKILFMCVANSARSQMAEGLAREILGTKADVMSAGSAPTKVNPFAVKAMAEHGIDISAHTSKSIDDLTASDFDMVVTLCSDEVCPILPGKTKRLHWPLTDPDPKGLKLSDEEILVRFRTARDQIREKIKALTELMGV